MLAYFALLGLASAQKPGCCYDMGHGAMMVPCCHSSHDVHGELGSSEYRDMVNKSECPTEQRMGGATKFQKGYGCTDLAEMGWDTSKEKDELCVCTREFNQVCGADGKTYNNPCLAECEDQEYEMGACEDETETVCVCTREYDPVCGNDGETYPNPCEAGCANQEYEMGACDDGEKEKTLCLCTRELDPVCGADGETYNNPCLAECEDQEYEMGACECVCTEEYEPVCGDNGETYSNACYLGCEDGVEMAYQGECRDCACTREMKQVCGKDGKTYNNKCLAKCAGTTVDHKGECEEKECICTEEYEPVCGDDMNTYDNICYANCAKAEVLHPGECQRFCVCTMEWEPVCGMDDTTYGNLCGLNCADVEKKHDGECEKDAECRCTREYAPVCGDDNETYGNKCMLDCEKINMAHLGECVETECTCTREFNPVCGSDGQTYNNPCLAKCAGVEVESEEACPLRQEGESCGSCFSITGFCGVCDRGLSCECVGMCADPMVADYPSTCVKKEECNCNRQWDPQCGEDGKTYSNECAAECAGATIDYEGECEDVCTCTREYDPVCGEDGMTYSNSCEAGCAGVKVASEGMCERKKLGESCGSCFSTTGYCGDCERGLSCECVGDCANPMIMDAPSTCVEKVDPLDNMCADEDLVRAKRWVTEKMENKDDAKLCMDYFDYDDAKGEPPQEMVCGCTNAMMELDLTNELFQCIADPYTKITVQEMFEYTHLGCNLELIDCEGREAQGCMQMCATCETEPLSCPPKCSMCELYKLCKGGEDGMCTDLDYVKMFSAIGEKMGEEFDDCDEFFHYEERNGKEAPPEVACKCAGKMVKEDLTDEMFSCRLPAEGMPDVGMTLGSMFEMMDMGCKMAPDCESDDAKRCIRGCAGCAVDDSDEDLCPKQCEACAQYATCLGPVEGDDVCEGEDYTKMMGAMAEMLNKKAYQSCEAFMMWESEDEDPPQEMMCGCMNKLMKQDLSKEEFQCMADPNSKMTAEDMFGLLFLGCNPGEIDCESDDAKRCMRACSACSEEDSSEDCPDSCDMCEIYMGCKKDGNQCSNMEYTALMTDLEAKMNAKAWEKCDTFFHYEDNFGEEAPMDVQCACVTKMMKQDLSEHTCEVDESGTSIQAYFEMMNMGCTMDEEDCKTEEAVNCVRKCRGCAEDNENEELCPSDCNMCRQYAFCVDLIPVCPPYMPYKCHSIDPTTCACEECEMGYELDNLGTCQQSHTDPCATRKNGKGEDMPVAGKACKKMDGCVWDGEQCMMDPLGGDCVKPNMMWKGDKSTMKSYKAEDPEECYEKCFKKAKCEGWTWVNKKKNKKPCKLYSAAVETKKKKKFFSGTRSCHPKWGTM